MNKINNLPVLIITIVVIALATIFILSLIFFSLFSPPFGVDVFPDFPEPNLDDKKVLEECRATGCSGQICAEEEIMTTCEFLPEYACYKTAKCERQSDGQCGWTSSEKLVVCLRQTREGKFEPGI